MFSNSTPSHYLPIYILPDKDDALFMESFEVVITQKSLTNALGDELLSEEDLDRILIENGAKVYILDSK